MIFPFLFRGSALANSLESIKGAYKFGTIWLFQEFKVTFFKLS